MKNEDESQSVMLSESSHKKPQYYMIPFSWHFSKHKHRDRNQISRYKDLRGEKENWL